MNAIRPDETLDNLHSIYVDQWDWEKVIPPDKRNLQTLRGGRRGDLRRASAAPSSTSPRGIRPSARSCRRRSLSSPPKSCAPAGRNSARGEREDRICAEHRAVFVIGIGGELPDGQPHDGRAPDYDDWTTPQQRWRPRAQRRHPALEPGSRTGVRDLLDGHPRRPADARCGSSADPSA